MNPNYQNGLPRRKDEQPIRCSIEGCPGHYELKTVTHTVRHTGEVVVIDHVPAEVCDVCGDVLFSPETIRRVESILRSMRKPDTTVPLYEYA
jgi:YgiT-type zinc finger domain-containing protein